MPNELKPCECVIGIWWDYDDTDIVTEKELLKSIDSRNRTYKNEFQKFEYCPFCGKKIDLDSMRRRANDEKAD